MRITERLTPNEINELFAGNSIGFFPFLILPSDRFYNKLYDLCLGYYMHRSGLKTLSPTYEKLISLVEDNVNSNKSAEEMLASIIRGKFIEKWDRVYDVLLFQQYNALDTFEMETKKAGNNVDTNTYNTTTGKTGNNSDTTTYDTDLVDNGKTSTNEIVTRKSADNNYVYGFNSTGAVANEDNSEETTETTVGDADKNTTYNSQKKTGTESKIFGVNESETHTGTDSKNMVIDETQNRRGRTSSGAAVIEQELNLRNTQLFFDIIYADIDSVATLQIYI